MIKLQKLFLTFWVLLFSVVFTVAAEQPVRHFDKEKIKQYKADKRFLYETDPEMQTPGWLEKLLNSLFGERNFSGLANVMEVLMWIACIALIVYVIFKLLKVDLTGLWRSEKTVRASVVEETELPSAPDLQKLLDEAIADNNFRNAVRYYYLIVLQELKSREIIYWSVNKTNRDYLKEITNPDIKAGFRRVSSAFDYTWYGGFELSQERFSQINHTFTDFLHKIKRGI